MAEPVRVDAAVGLFAALAHPVRLKVLALLGREGPLTIAELRDRLDVEASALSHQLRILRDARLVVRVPEGRSARVALHDHHVAQIVEDALAHVAEVGSPD